MPGLPRSRARRALRRAIHRRIDSQRDALLHACVVLVVCLLSVGAYRSAWVPLVAALVFYGVAARRKKMVLPAEGDGVDGGGFRGEHHRNLSVNSDGREADA
jgi:hypothetical protein